MFISFQLQLILQTSEFAYCSNNSVLKIKPQYTCSGALSFRWNNFAVPLLNSIQLSDVWAEREKRKKSQSISFHRSRPSQRRKSINARNSLQEMKYVSFCLLAKSYLTLVTPQTVAHWAAPSITSPRQEYCNEWPFSYPGDLWHPGIEHTSPGAPALLADSATEPPGKLEMC